MSWWRRLLQPNKVPGWLLLLGGFLGAIESLDALISLWERAEEMIPPDTQTLIGTIWPYAFMVIGLVWLYWASTRWDQIVPIKQLAIVRRTVRIYALEAMEMNDAIHNERQRIDHARRSTSDDESHAILQTYQPPDIKNWYAEVLKYVENELGRPLADQFNAEFKNKKMESDDVNNFSKSGKFADFLHRTNGRLLKMAERITVVDLDQWR